MPFNLKTQDRPDAKFVVLGAAFGAAFGAVFDSVGLGVAFGLLAGIVIGIVLKRRGNAARDGADGS